MNIISTMRFLEYGKPAPKNSGFKGIINGTTVFGTMGWMSYTSRKDAVDPTDTDSGTKRESNLIGYSGRAVAEKGYTMSSFGFLDSDEKRDAFRTACRSAFKSDGDLIWDVVISLNDYDHAAGYGLNDQSNYGAFINTVLMNFFKRVDLDPKNMLWWEDYHSNTEHPHMHVCFLEKKHTRDRGRFSAKELRQLKYCIARELTAREIQQKDISEASASEFRQKDKEKADVLKTVKKISFDSISGIDDLVRVLPRTGRLQYGAFQIAPFRPVIDRITDSLLESELLMSSFQTYLSRLEELEGNIDEKSGSHVAVLRERELEQLHKDIGNIILKYVKEVRSSNDTRTGYRFLEDMLKRSDENYAIQDNDSAQWKDYRNLRDEYERISRLLSGTRRNDQMKETIGAMTDMIRKTSTPEIQMLLGYRLSLVYLYGRSVEKDPKQAEEYARIAIDNGCVQAYTLLAKTLFAQDKHSQGMRALLTGRINGDPGATYAYGVQLISGKHCTKNREEGIAAIMTAAELGCMQAANYIRTHEGSLYKEAATKAAVSKVSSSAHRMIFGRNIGGEVASFINNSDRIHVYHGQIEREIDAYLNDKNRIAQKSL